MKIDLRKVFEPVTKTSREDNPVTTIICDVYGTLIRQDGSFNEPLAEFLKWADEHGATVFIASNRNDAEQEVRRLDSRGLLLNLAIHDKTEIQSLVFRRDLDIAAVDDDIMIWLGASIMVTPTDTAFEKFLKEKSYQERGFTP